MGETDILRKSALEQGQLIRAGELSSQELTEIYLARIARLDGDISSFVEVLADSALRAARHADRRRPQGNFPFWGVPIAIKDLNAIRGTFMRMGSRSFAHFISPMDDLVVAHLRRAGFIFVGKTATSEFGAMPVTEPDIHPPTRNPFDVRVTAGGSSGGSAAAVASDLVPIAQGTDGGGSVRIPASFCGLVGFKPSRGVVENPFGIERADIIWSCGPLARSVDDAVALLDVMANRPANGPTFAEQSRRATGPLRIRVAIDAQITHTAAEVRTAVERTAAILDELGHQVETTTFLPNVSIEDFLPIWQANTAQLPLKDWSLTQPVTRWLGEVGVKLDAAEVSRQIASVAARVHLLLADADILLTPTVAVPPPPIGLLRGIPPSEGFRRAAELGAFTAPFNISGQPAISLPTGLSHQNHPIGVQLVGREHQDGTVVALARVLEERLGGRDWVAARKTA